MTRRSSIERVRLSAKLQRQSEGHEATHIPPEMWGECYPTLQQLTDAMERESGRTWAMPEGKMYVECRSAPTNRGICGCRVRVSDKGKGWHLLSVDKRHASHCADCETLATIGLRSVPYPVGIPDDRVGSTSCFAFLSPSEALCHGLGDTYSVIATVPTDKTDRVSYPLEHISHTNLPNKRVLSNSSYNWKHTVRIGPQVYSVEQISGHDHPTLSILDIETSQWRDVKRDPAAPWVTLCPKGLYIPRENNHGVFSLEGDLFALGMTRIRGDGKDKKSTVVWNAWRYTVDTGVWSCVPHSLLTVGSRSRSQYRSILDACVVVGARVYCYIGQEMWSYSPPREGERVRHEGWRREGRVPTDSSVCPISLGHYIVCIPTTFYGSKGFHVYDTVQGVWVDDLETLFNDPNREPYTLGVSHDTGERVCIEREADGGYMGFRILEPFLQ
ncbi:hypothetical protein KIPB_002637 [Kipferlia bialata]|uniref:Uncharacterized protein n=1 Tax=Kipferlia bialata TaxID=797122 RepID=A0A9K3CQY6_9EUKA|nr:hypothetical protein KIPB_002637 [Kipferlia bialata]|eukprot:g2637.t1